VTSFERGLSLFDAGEYFESHEALEAEWTAERGARRMFLQALIHFAVAAHHQGNGNLIGARRQLDKALRKLAGYLPRYEGLETGRIYREGREAFDLLAAGAPAPPLRFRERTAL
jgi:predicted metal-dependent hydrolase